MTVLVRCPACVGEGIREYRPHTLPSDQDETVRCDLCRGIVVDEQGRCVVPKWRADRWKAHPTQPTREGN